MNPNQPTREPGLSIRLDAAWSVGILRADQIRHDTLVSLVQHWGNPAARCDIINQLDALAEAVNYPIDGELDALVQAVEVSASMDDAETRIDLHTALRLNAELDAVTPKLIRFNPARDEQRRPQCPEALYDRETGDLTRCIIGPHKLGSRHRAESGIEWRAPVDTSQDDALPAQGDTE